MRKGSVKDARAKNILCIGAGYVGGPSMAVLADRCRSKKVTVVDVNAAKIRAWKGSKLPIFEPGLDKIVKRTRGKNLFFSTDIPGEIERADMIFVCVNTPTKVFGYGEGYASDMQYVEKTARMILRHARPETIVVEKSTVPVRTAGPSNASSAPGRPRENRSKSCRIPNSWRRARPSGIWRNRIES